MRNFLYCVMFSVAAWACAYGLYYVCISDFNILEKCIMLGCCVYWATSALFALKQLKED